MPEFSSFILWLAHQRTLGESSHYCGFIRTLPAPADMQSAIFLDEGEIRALPPSLRRACENARVRTDAALNFIEDMARESPQLADLFSDHPQLLDRDLRKWAAAILLSRGFTVRRHMMLLPAIDLVNSLRNGATCELQFDASGAPILRSTCAVRQGTEIFIDYGNDKSDEELMACYGYSHAAADGHKSTHFEHRNGRTAG